MSAPRIAAIEYPLGRTLGQPGDVAGQLVVLRAVLQALMRIQTPGQVIHLPFEWKEEAKLASEEKLEEPPIVKHILRHPWLLPRLLRREIPG